ncbi:MAG TPA: hypothetical protein VKR38_18175 [Usitatibacter sp.]|nr:hypothetical protein [Usitatibacter sp.]
MATVRIVRDSPITRSEWRECVAADPELRPDGEDSVLWSRLAPHEFTLLVWRDGGIEARDPTPELLAKMERMAHAFRAAVRDDEELRRIAERKPKPRRGPLRLDPLQWQVVSYLVAAIVIIGAAALVLVAMHVTR